MDYLDLHLSHVAQVVWDTRYLSHGTMRA